MKQRQFTRYLRSHMTESESRLWRHLRAHRLDGQKFRRQQPIGPYVVDFVHFGARLIVEADGGQHNDAPHDKQRDDWLRQQGFTVLRFWNNEIMGNLESVLATIMDAVTRPPSPQPLSRKGRGASDLYRLRGEQPRNPSSSPAGGGMGEQPPAQGHPGRLSSPLAGEGLGERGKKRSATQYPGGDR